MGPILTLLRRELATYFLGPMAYLVLLAIPGGRLRQFPGADPHDRQAGRWRSPAARTP